MKFGVINRSENTAQAFTRFPRNGSRFTSPRLHALLILTSTLLMLTSSVTAGLLPTTTIQVTELRFDTNHSNLTIRWDGGFPPYHVRFTPDLNAGWTEYPRPIATNELTFVAPEGGSMFFQVRTEYEPLEITAMQYAADANFALLQWRGGTPPFQVQQYDPYSDSWDTIPELLNQRHFEGIIVGESKLFRIASVPVHPPLEAPQELILYGSRCDRVLLGWEPADNGLAGAGLLGYAVYRDDLPIVQLPPTARMVLDEGLLPDTTHTYQIAAIDIMGNEGNLSNPLIVTTPDCSLTDTNVVYEDCRLTLTWDQNEEPTVAGYLVYWGTEPGVYPWQVDVMQMNKVTIPDLTPGAAYFVSVTAYTIDGVESEPAPELIFIPPSPTETAYSSKTNLGPLQASSIKVPSR